MFGLLRALAALLMVIPKALDALRGWLRDRKIRRETIAEGNRQAEVRAAKAQAEMATHDVETEQRVRETLRQPVEDRVARLRVLYRRDKL